MLMLRLALASVATGAVAMTLPGVATAQERGPAGDVRPPTAVAPVTGIIADTVFLRNGGTVRGTIHELVPGDHVTVLGPGGEIWSVPWAQVERVELGNRPGGGAVTPATPAAPVVRPSASATGGKAAKVGPTVRLHIESKRAVQLYRQPAQDGVWHEECTSPCDLDMPLGDEYRIAGSGIFQSRDFRLEGAPGSRVVIDIDPSSRSTFVIGGVLTAVGGIVDYVGLVAAVAASASSYCTYDSSTSYSSSCSSDKSSGMVAAGMLIAGTAMMVTGVIVMIANSGTGVTQVESSASAASRRPLDAYKREAIWRTPSAATQAAPPAIAVPIFSHSF